MSRRTLPDLSASVTRKRCAVYTRKSTDEGLEKEFNTLDAQREACEAYISSQRAEGWTLVADRYDDGGFSGGSLDRPALKRLLADNQIEPAQTHYDDAVWVGYRLSELLPFKLKVKQDLLEMNDSVTRLRIIDQFLRQNAR